MLQRLKRRVLGIGLVVLFTPIILLFSILDALTGEPKTDEQYIYAELD